MSASHEHEHVLTMMCAGMPVPDNDGEMHALSDAALDAVRWALDRVRETDRAERLAGVRGEMLAEVRAQLAAERAACDALAEAAGRYVDYHGPCAAHHQDDCPGDCAPCEIDRAISAALAAHDARRNGGAG